MRQLPGRHGREVVGRKGHQAGRVTAGAQGQLRVAAREIQFDFRPFGQLANDFVQRDGWGCRCTVTAGSGRNLLDDGDFHIGGG